jgi:hypothetical protein
MSAQFLEGSSSGGPPAGAYAPTGGGPPLRSGPTTGRRAFTPEADPSAEMEALRLRRIRHAFAGPLADEGRASPLARGLVVGSVLALLAVLGGGVAGAVQASLAAKDQEQHRQNQPSTTVPVSAAPPTAVRVSPTPVTSATPSSTARPASR